MVGSMANMDGVNSRLSTSMIVAENYLPCHSRVRLQANLLDPGRLTSLPLSPLPLSTARQPNPQSSNHAIRITTFCPSLIHSLEPWMTL